MSVSKAQDRLFRIQGKPCLIIRTEPTNDDVSGLALGSAELPDTIDGIIIDECNVIFNTDDNQALLDARRNAFLPENDPFRDYDETLVIKVKATGAEYRIKSVGDEPSMAPALWKCAISARASITAFDA